MRHIIKNRRNPGWKGDGDGEGKKKSPISKHSALFSFSLSLSPPPSFFSLLTSNNTGSDLTDTEMNRGPQHLEKGQFRGLCVMQVKWPVGTVCRGTEAQGSVPHFILKDSFGARDEHCR